MFEREKKNKKEQLMDCTLGKRSHVINTTNCKLETYNKFNISTFYALIFCGKFYSYPLYYRCSICQVFLPITHLYTYNGDNM